MGVVTTLNSADGLQHAWEAAVNKVRFTSQSIGAQFPHGSHDGSFQLMAPSYWTAGFWPGILWLVYRDQPDERLRQMAVCCEEQLDNVLYRFTSLDHDMGFMWTLTAIANWRLTQNESSRERALTAASHLAARFNIKGQFIRAWNHSDRVGWAIIDCMMNLPLLYFAADQMKDPRFKHIAIGHADMVAKYFIREDGSAYHIVCFDPENGERVGARGGQGYAEESAWARGCAWAIYGLVLSYQHSLREPYLEAAKRAADFFLSHVPDDQVPYWDFRAPIMEDTPRDSSAAAIAACGLLDIAEALEGERAAYYRSRALSILKSLYENYSATGTEQAVLLHGTGNLPGHQNIDKPLIYGDYFYMEALSKALGHSSFWQPDTMRLIQRKRK
jgi:unsaturated chondroitin disaccharide hydrolase